jgi:hypothetical protein
MRRISIYGELERMRKGTVWPSLLIGPFFGIGMGGEKNRRPWGDIHIRCLSKTKKGASLAIA